MTILKFVALLGIVLHGVTTVQHSMTLYLLGSSGFTNIPEFTAIADVDEEIMTYYDSNIKRIEPRQRWVTEFMERDKYHWGTNTQECMHYQELFKDETESFKRLLNQIEGGHIKQQILICEWDDETNKVTGSNQHSFNGEDFLKFDLEKGTWIAENAQAEVIKQDWDRNNTKNMLWKHFITVRCTEWLKKYLNNGQSHLKRKVRPSVSLLQKTSSSPVSCHASGFYPKKSSLFWRKDGEEIHEGVNPGKILHNHDGTFQTNVDLDLSSVKDWRRYECVFQLTGLKEIVIKLDEDVIRTNGVNPDYVPAVIVAVVLVLVLVLVLVAAVGFMVHRKKKAAECPPSPDNSSELSERLNPESSSTDSTQKLNPESSSTDSTQKLNPESSSTDSTQKLNPES